MACCLARSPSCRAPDFVTITSNAFCDTCCPCMLSARLGRLHSSRFATQLGRSRRSRSSSRTTSLATKHACCTTAYRTTAAPRPIILNFPVPVWHQRLPMYALLPVLADFGQTFG